MSANKRKSSRKAPHASSENPNEDHKTLAVPFYYPYKQRPDVTKIISDATAKRFLLNLHERGCDTAKLLRHVCAAVVLSDVQLFPKGHWTHIDGKSPWTVRRFPTAVKEFAQQVASFNTSPLFARGASEFGDLPRMLGRYADYVEESLETLGPIAAEHDRYSNLGNAVLARLPDQVYAATGEYEFARLAGLVKTAFRSIGLQSKISYASLRDLHKRSGIVRSLDVLNFKLDEHGIEFTVGVAL